MKKKQKNMTIATTCTWIAAQLKDGNGLCPVIWETVRRENLGENEDDDGLSECTGSSHQEGESSE
jgi:hypothetical protein